MNNVLYKGYDIVLEDNGWFVYKDGYGCGPFYTQEEAVKYIDWNER